MTANSLAPPNTVVTGGRALWMIVSAVLVWTLVSWLSNGNLDGYNDMLENYAWAQPLSWGTHKHPPLFAWVTGLWFLVFPQNDGFYRLLSYVNVGVGLWGVYVLGCRLGLKHLAAMGAALLLWSFPYTTLAGKFNANSQLLSLWPWAAALLVMSWQEKGWRGFFVSMGLGLVAAACMLSKYYSGVFLAGFLVPTLLSEQGRRWLLTPRPYVALLFFALALAPHVAWMSHHNWISLQYVQEQGDGKVSWSYVLRFALSPLFYWLPAWLAVCAVYGVAAAREQSGSALRWTGHFLLSSWKCQGLGDVLFWLAMLPGGITLMFGMTAVVELSTPWAIPIGYAFVLLWLRNLDLQVPQVSAVALGKLAGFWRWSLLIVALVGAVMLWSNMRNSNSGYYRPTQEAAQTIVAQWRERHPGQTLGWVGGQWGGNAMLSFYAQPHLRSYPGTPESDYARLYTPFDWEHQPGLLLCLRGPVTETPGPSEDSAECEQQARQWLEKRGQSTEPIVVNVQRSGRMFPHPKPHAYAVFDVMPQEAAKP